MDRNPTVRKTTRPPAEHESASKEQGLIKRIWKTVVALAAGIAIIAGLINNSGTIGNFIENVHHHFSPYSAPTPNPNQALLSEVEGLIPGVNIQLYQSEFGVPAFINYHTDHTTKYKEYVFINTYFYLDAVTDMNDAVQMFAITIRDKTFNPVFKSPVVYPFNQPSFQITLGLSKLSDLPADYTSCSVGSDRFAYYETLYLGERGGNEDFGFGINQAGYLPSNAFSVLFDMCGSLNPYTPDLQTLKQLRTQIPFNTYAVAVGDLDLSIKKYTNYDLGVNFDQVE